VLVIYSVVFAMKWICMRMWNGRQLDLALDNMIMEITMPTLNWTCKLNQLDEIARAGVTKRLSTYPIRLLTISWVKSWVHALFLPFAISGNLRRSRWSSWTTEREERRVWAAESLLHWVVVTGWVPWHPIIVDARVLVWVRCFFSLLICDFIEAVLKHFVQMHRFIIARSHDGPCDLSVQNTLTKLREFHVNFTADECN